MSGVRNNCPFNNGGLCSYPGLYNVGIRDIRCDDFPICDRYIEYQKPTQYPFNCDDAKSVIIIKVTTDINPALTDTMTKEFVNSIRKKGHDADFAILNGDDCMCDVCRSNPDECGCKGESMSLANQITD